MDELFLQILRANEDAQTQIAQTHDASSDNVSQLNALKETIDASELEKFELEALAIKNKTQQRIDSVNSEAKALFESKKDSLRQDFVKVSSDMKASILKQVCELNGE